MMTVKEYLSQIRRIDRKIWSLMETRDILISKAMQNQSPQLVADKVQSSGGNSGMSAAVERFVDIEAEIKKQTDRYAAMMWAIVKQITELDDPKYVQLLYLKYVQYKRLEEIACIMLKPNGEPYNYEYIKRMHGWALEAFRRKYPYVTQMLPLHDV